jgi:hypothetical protein
MKTKTREIGAFEGHLNPGEDFAELSATRSRMAGRGSRVKWGPQFIAMSPGFPLFGGKCEKALFLEINERRIAPC